MAFCLCFGSLVYHDLSSWFRSTLFINENERGDWEKPTGAVVYKSYLSLLVCLHVSEMFFLSF